MTRRGRAAADIAGPLVVLAVLVGLWYLMHHWGMRRLFDRPGWLLPPWHDILYDSFVRDIPGFGAPRTRMLQALGVTVRIMFAGLGISVVCGIALAVAMASARWLERSIWPHLVAIQAVPILVISPVLGAIVGRGERSRLIVCVIISIVPIVSSTLFGLRSADRDQHDLFTLRGASWFTRLRKLQLPAALPAIFNGFRISAGLAVIGTVVGELFFRQGGTGIGVLMDEYRQRNQFTLVYGALLLSSLLGIAVFFAFGWIQRLVIGRWHVIDPHAEEQQ